MKRQPLVRLGAFLLCVPLLVGACSDSDKDSSGTAKSATTESSAPGSGTPAAETQLAATPPMGWNSWNQVRCHDLTEDVVKRAADALVRLGLDKLGYRYVVVDDCWQAPQRDANGSLVANPVTFPSGLKALVDYVHERGLKFGLYLVPGSKTCAMIWDGYQAEGIGSHGHERQDAEMLQGLGVDYLKYDWCSADETDGLERKAAFTLMHDELQRLSRPIVYSISEYGETEPWAWAPPIANMWRTTGDIAPVWLSIVNIINNQADLAPYAGPGHWNDPDMLQVGNGGLTADEARAHVGMWAMLAAPLMLGTDLDAMAPEVLAVVSNKEVLAIDQDPLGKQARRVQEGEGEIWTRTEVWARPLAGGDHAVALLNKSEAPTEIATTLETAGVPAGKWKVRDVSDGVDLPPSEGPLVATVPAHGVTILRLSADR